MDRTEAQLRSKLLQKEYPAEVVEDALSYVKSFGYINDVNYAKRFVEWRKVNKSKREIYAALIRKGLEKDMIEAALEECYSSDDAIETIQRLVQKKHFSTEYSTEEEKKKICNYLLRKGFYYEDIRKVLQVSSWNA
jgi:regulatory protein